MWKRIYVYLLIGMLGYAIGTISSTHAAAPKKEDNSKEILAITKKVDQILTNQAEIKKQLKRIFAKL